MIVANSNTPIVTHPTSVLGIFQFSFNDPDHFISLSDSADIIEWTFNTKTGKYSEIEKCKLARPKDDILKANKHELPKLTKNDYLKITKFLKFDNFLAIGYEDGLIIVYTVIKQNTENIEEIQQEKDEDQQNSEEEMNDNNNINVENTSKSYYNIFSMYYILFGHTQKITAFNYIPANKMLLTASDNSTLRIYDMETGKASYQFNFDCIINNIVYYETKKQKQIILFSNEPYKLIIDITNEPYSFNHYTFKYNDMTQLIETKTEYIGISASNLCYSFKGAIDPKKTFKCKDRMKGHLIFEFNKVFGVFDEDNWLRVVELIEGKAEEKDDKNAKDKKKKPAKGKKDDKKKKEIPVVIEDIMLTKLKIKMGTDLMNSYYIKDDYVFGCNTDHSIYSVNLTDKINIAWERTNMKLEEDISELYNIDLANTKSKKKKGGKDDKKKKKK